MAYPVMRGWPGPPPEIASIFLVGKRRLSSVAHWLGLFTFTGDDALDCTGLSTCNRYVQFQNGCYLVSTFSILFPT